MCSITNTAHHAHSSGVGPRRSSSFILPRLQAWCLLSCKHVIMLSCNHVHMLSCDHVYMLSCRQSLITTDTTKKGSCNQGKEVQNFYYGGVTRRHSFGERCTHYTFKKVVRKKTLSCDKVLFISPIRDSNWFGFQYPNQRDYVIFFFRRFSRNIDAVFFHFFTDTVESSVCKNRLKIITV